MGYALLVIAFVLTIDYMVGYRKKNLKKQAQAKKPN